MMIRFILIPLFLLLSFHTVNAQQGWAFLKGQPSDDEIVAGTIGQPHRNNTPGPREALTWSVNGKLFLYDGRHSATTSPNEDMWMFDTLTRNWTLINTKQGGQIRYDPVYGTKGVATVTNHPGERYKSLTWALNNKLYLYGGGNNYVPGASNDLWEYDISTNLWTWIDGMYSTCNAVFGTAGIPAASNRPGTIADAHTWVKDGKLYLFGGKGCDSLKSGELNDIWEFNPDTHLWTWIKGSKKVNMPPKRGSKNVSDSTNMPASQVTASWYLNGKFFIIAERDELWEYSFATNNWTWIKGDRKIKSPVFGTKNLPDSTVTPGGATLNSLYWVHGNKLLLSDASITNSKQIEILWEYNPATNNWVWLRSTTLSDDQPYYGVYNVADPKVCPITKLKRSKWQLGNKVYYMFSQVSDAIWEFNNDTKLWRWIKGSHNIFSRDFLVYPSLYPKLPSVLNEPGNNFAVDENDDNWQINDTFYRYTPSDQPNVYYMWRYEMSKNVWTVIHAAYADSFVKGAGIKNTPGLRDNFYSWHHNNKLYIYGGEMRGVGGGRICNELWTYDLSSNTWACISNGIPGKINSMHGVKGVPAINNTPGKRFDYGEAFLNGKLYVFGGEDDNGNVYNDLWEFDPSTTLWTWLKGDSVSGKGAIFGTKGVASANNTPGSRSSLMSTAANSKLYIFGGVQSYFAKGLLNDLWEYNPLTNNWKWLSGEKNPEDAETISWTKGIPNVNNTPGRRCMGNMAAMNNKLYMLGGVGIHIKGHDGFLDEIFLDDIWEYDLSNQMWTLIEGSKNEANKAYFDTRCQFDKQNIFGFGHYQLCWANNFHIYIYDGTTVLANLQSYDQYYQQNTTNGLWAYDLCKDVNICYANPPVITLDSVMALCGTDAIELNAGNVGCKFLWSTSDTTQVIGVNTPGKYWVKVTNPANKVSTDTISIIAGAGPVINLPADTVICEGDSILLNATNVSSKYHWNTGDTTALLYAKNGNYNVIVIKDNGCYTVADIEVKTKPSPPRPELSKSGPLCSGEVLIVRQKISTKNLSFYGPTGFLDFNSHYRLANVQPGNSGIYYAIDSLNNGCWKADSIYVQVDAPYTPAVTIAASPATQLWPYVQAEFKANTIGANINWYQWYKNGNTLAGQNSDTYRAIAQADFTNGDVICVTINDTGHCAVVDTTTACTQPLTIKLSVNDLVEERGIKVFPNPSNDYLIVIIQHIVDDANIDIISTIGQVVFTAKPHSKKTEIDISILPAGIYTLRYTSGGHTENIKLVKQ